MLNKTTGLLCPTNFAGGGIDTDAAFWNNLPLSATSIVVTARLGPADGVVFYFAEPEPCCQIVCPSNITVTGYPGTIVTYPTPAPGALCGSNVTVTVAAQWFIILPCTTTVTCMPMTVRRASHVSFRRHGNRSSSAGHYMLFKYSPNGICRAIQILARALLFRSPGHWRHIRGLLAAFRQLFPKRCDHSHCHATNACGATNQCSFAITVSFGGTEPPCADPPANMVMWLRFDETNGTTALNASAGNHGVLFNGVTRALNQYVVNSLCFDAVNDYVQVTPYPAMQFGTNDFSVDAWVKPSTVENTVRMIVDHARKTAAWSAAMASSGGNTTLAFQLADGTFMNYVSTLNVPATEWHLVAVTVKATTHKASASTWTACRIRCRGIREGHQGSVTAGHAIVSVGSRSRQ